MNTSPLDPGRVPAGPDHAKPDNPVDTVRRKIRCAQDCLSRALDALAVEYGVQWVYPAAQLMAATQFCDEGYEIAHDEALADDHFNDDELTDTPLVTQVTAADLEDAGERPSKGGA